MRHLSIRMTVASPLAIRSDHAPGGATASKYILGTSFIGALTDLYRSLYADSEQMEAFAPLFLSEQVRYPNLYPARFRDDGLQNQTTVPVSPLPVTAQSCKRHPGFHFPDDEENDAHGVRDALLDWALFKLTSADKQPQDNAQPLKILQEGRDCRCGEAMDHYNNGYYRRSNVEPHQMIAAQVEGHTRLQTHTGIHRASGTVQESILYNRQVFEEGMQFWGDLLVPATLFAPLTSFLREIGSKGLLRLGTGRTRGMGKVTLAFKEPDEQETLSTFKQRLDALNDAFHKRAKDLNLSVPGDYFFALTLHAPLILRDDFLRYRSVIDAATLMQILKEYCEEDVPELQDVYCASRVRRVSGWQELWGTPRTNEYAIESGSVFLFSCASPPSDALLKALFTLEEQGIGKRRAEGFGRIRVSDEFHQQVEQEA
jgi:CRISPR-associated protein Csx10